MTKAELIETLEEILENARYAYNSAENAKSNADEIEYCTLGDVISTAESASSEADEAMGYAEEIKSSAEYLIRELNESELEEDTTNYDEMINEVKRTTEERLNSFEEALSSKENDLAELKRTYESLAETIRNDLENLEKEIKGDE